MTTLEDSIRIEKTALSVAFFSPINLAHLQVRLREVIYKKTRHIIDRQSDEQMAIVMRAIFLRTMPHAADDVQRELARLNNGVLAEVVPLVGSGIAQYLSYLRDSTTQPLLLDRPINESIKGRDPVMYTSALI
jgi:hypothetical protein